MTQNLIIMAAGASSRMKSSVSDLVDEHINEQANSRTKGLIEIGDDAKPLLYYLLRNVQDAGYKTVYFVTGRDASFFRSTIEKLPNLEHLEFKFATQFIPEGRIKPLGTADSIQQALDQFPELKKTYFSVCNSDNLYSVEAFQNLRSIEENHGLIAYDLNHLNFSKEKIAGFSLLVFDADFKLLSIVEKPSSEEFRALEETHGTVYVSMNCFTFNGATFYSFLKECPLHPVRNEKELPNAISNLIALGLEAVHGIPMREHVPDLTTKTDILAIEEFLKNRNTLL